MKSTTKVFNEAYELLYKYDYKEANRLWDEYHNAIWQDYQDKLTSINKKYEHK